MEELQRRLEQKTAQLSALREISQAIQAAWDLDTTLDLITRKTAEVMAMNSCSIYLRPPSFPPKVGEDEGGEEDLILRATTGLAAEAIGRVKLGWGEGITGWAAREGKPVGVRDAVNDPRFKYLPETRELNFKSLLAVPLVSQGRVIGAMNVQTTEFHDYGEEEVELLSLIGDLAAGALEKAMLYEGMRERIAELSTLVEVSKAVISPLYLDEMLNLVVEMAARIMDARLCSLMLLDEEKGELIIRATQTPSEAYLSKPPLKVGEGIVGMVAQEGAPLAVLDVREDPRYHYADLARREGLCSLLCVPLKVRDRVIGVFNCYTAAPHRFSQEEVALFSTLANQTALAIENARLVTNAAVIREMHHRVKNNLQTIAMLLRLQMSEQAAPINEVLSEAINRILSIAVVHDILSQEGFRLVDVREMIERLARTIAQNMLSPGQDIGISVRGDGVVLSAQQATALALAVNELVQNAIKHAFVGRRQGAIAISLAKSWDRLTVEVQDDGVGLPSGSAARPSHLGLQIVQTLVEEDLKGHFTITTEKGTKAVIQIPMIQ
jgi:signal transduction protein with GAF and PtsI domain